MDNSSTYNLVSEVTVQNLDLRRLEHPCPYGISSFWDDHMVKVKEKCCLIPIAGFTRMRYYVL